MGKRYGKNMMFRMQYHFQGSELIMVIFASFLLILSGCQKRQRVIIHVGASSSEESVLDGMEVINEDYDAALKRCEERLLMIGADDSEEAADVYSFMGGIYAGYTSDKDQAIYYINKAIEIHERDGDDIGLAWDYSRMGKAYIHCDEEEPEKGLEYLERAEELCDKYKEYGLDESILMATVWSSRGDLNGKLGEYDKALEAYDAAQRIYEKKQQPDAQTYWDKGFVYWDMGEYELAEEECLKARDLYRENQELYYEARLNSELGYFYMCIDKYDESIDCYMQALEFYTSTNCEIENQAMSYINMAFDFNMKGDFEEAVKNSVIACRIVEGNVSIVDDKGGRYKNNLSLYYSEWTDNKMEEDFESWYKRVVLDGKDWR